MSRDNTTRNDYRSSSWRYGTQLLMTIAVVPGAVYAPYTLQSVVMRRTGSHSLYELWREHFLPAFFNGHALRASYKAGSAKIGVWDATARTQKPEEDPFEFSKKFSGLQCLFIGTADTLVTNYHSVLTRLHQAKIIRNEPFSPAHLFRKFRIGWGLALTYNTTNAAFCFQVSSQIKILVQKQLAMPENSLLASLIASTAAGTAFSYMANPIKLIRERVIASTNGKTLIPQRTWAIATETFRELGIRTFTRGSIWSSITTAMVYLCLDLINRGCDQTFSESGLGSRTAFWVLQQKQKTNNTPDTTGMSIYMSPYC